MLEQLSFLVSVLCSHRCSSYTELTVLQQLENDKATHNISIYISGVQIDTAV